MLDSIAMFDEISAGIYLGGAASPIGPRTMQRWRATGQGPTFTKFGRLVRYSKDDLDAFKAQHRRASTSEAA
jgi:hypothetical protein